MGSRRAAAATVMGSGSIIISDLLNHLDMLDNFDILMVRVVGWSVVRDAVVGRSVVLLFNDNLFVVLNIAVIVVRTTASDASANVNQTAESAEANAAKEHVSNGAASAVRPVAIAAVAVVTWTVRCSDFSRRSSDFSNFSLRLAVSCFCFSEFKLEQKHKVNSQEKDRHQMHLLDLPMGHFLPWSLNAAFTTSSHYNLREP